jgi:hypothetical protein
VASVVLVPDDVTPLADCEAVSISGAEFLQLQASTASSGSSSGDSTVNVTADIFVGAVLVVCFAVGWIAGGQR